MDVELFNLISLGIGLAHICLAKGYKCVIFMPDTQSQVRILMNSKVVLYLWIRLWSPGTFFAQKLLSNNQILVLKGYYSWEGSLN